MKEIYDEMRARNIKNIVEKGLVFDSKICEDNIDKRKGIGLFAFGDFNLNPDFQDLLRASSDIFAGQVLYNISNSLGVLHFTFMQFRKVEDEDSDTKSLLKLTETYSQKLAPVLFEMGDLEIDYQGLIAIPTGILMYGYPNKDVNKYRELIRGLDLDMKEPYKADITHSTFIRLCNDKCDSATLLNFANKYSKVNLGSIKVKELYLGLGSWRMLPQEILMCYKFDLIKKEIISLAYE